MKLIIGIFIFATINTFTFDKDYFEDKEKNERVKSILKETEKYNYHCAWPENGCNLFRAIKHCSIKEVGVRILSCIDRINEPNAEGWLPITIACFNGRPLIIKLLLEFGADPFKKGWNNKNTFEYLLWEIEINKDHGQFKYYFSSLLKFLTEYCEKIGIFKTR